MESKRWYKLDNIGKLYSSLASNSTQNIFRFSATLKDNIDKFILQEALDLTIKSYPNFNVNLKKGIFWYFLEQSNKKFIVTEENLPICFKLYNNSNDFLYRVSYYKKRINFEVSHIISDGRGSINFFQTLIINYLKIRYELKDINNYSCSYLQCSEDSFLKYYKKTNNKVNDHYSTNIYRYNSKKLINKTRFFELHMSVKEVLKLAHEYHTTLTTLIISILIYAMKDVMSEKELNDTIKIDVPVDLRQYFKSFSTRNYFCLIPVIYKFSSREDSIEDIIKEVSKQFKNNLTKENLSIKVNQMVSLEKNIICRITPLFIKNIVLKIVDLYTRKLATSCVSNIGVIKFADNISSYIENINILVATNSFQFTLCSFEDDLSIGISSKYKYNEIIKKFCTYFSKRNINVIINASEVE